VIITPHNAFNTHEAIDRIRQTSVQNIIDFYKGKLPNKVEVKK
jgi:D-lactate dehydrogenase